MLVHSSVRRDGGLVWPVVWSDAALGCLGGGEGAIALKPGCFLAAAQPLAPQGLVKRRLLMSGGFAEFRENKKRDLRLQEGRCV